MQRTVCLKLIDPPEEDLMATVEAFRDACEFVCGIIQGGERANKIALHHRSYAQLRKTLPSQMAQTCIRAVCGTWRAWKANGSKGKPPIFRRLVACFQGNKDWSLRHVGIVSFATLRGRVKLHYKTSGGGEAKLAEGRKIRGLGGARLVKKKKGWFLDVTVSLPDPPTYVPATPIGIDRGINYMAVARAPGVEPLIVKGGKIKQCRDIQLKTRQRLQGKGTRSAKRVLKHQSGREKRFVLNEARVAAKEIVEYAKGFERPVLVLEDLRGIRALASRSKPKRSRRSRYLLSTWAYRVLWKCIGEEAEEYGVPLVLETPAWSSRTCPECGDARESNRKGAKFHCGHCGYRNHADVVGATNLYRRWLNEQAPQPWGSVNGPDGCGPISSDAQAAPLA